jgi:hypothetical protein
MTMENEKKKSDKNRRGGGRGAGGVARGLTIEERWYLIGKIEFALSKTLGFELSLSGYRDYEIEDIIIQKIQRKLADMEQPPLTAPELQIVLNAMQITNFIAEKVEKDVYDGRR